MKKQLGVEMTILSSSDRTNLMKGVVLRRVEHGRPLIKHQLDTALEQDFIEILKRFRTFDFESYVGVNLELFVASMYVGMLIAQRDHNGETLFERGPLADEFMAKLSETMTYMIEDMPMSTRGVFDNLKSEPAADRQITVSANDLMNQSDTNKHVITDDREAMKAFDRAKRGLDKKNSAPGPIVLP